jgi:hypothetical protein
MTKPSPDPLHSEVHIYFLPKLVVGALLQEVTDLHVDLLEGLPKEPLPLPPNNSL